MRCHDFSTFVWTTFEGLLASRSYLFCSECSFSVAAAAIFSSCSAACLSARQLSATTFGRDWRQRSRNTSRRTEEKKSTIIETKQIEQFHSAEKNKASEKILSNMLRQYFPVWQSTRSWSKAQNICCWNVALATGIKTNLTKYTYSKGRRRRRRQCCVTTIKN